MQSVANLGDASMNPEDEKSLLGFTAKRTLALETENENLKANVQQMHTLLVDLMEVMRPMYEALDEVERYLNPDGFVDVEEED